MVVGSAEQAVGNDEDGWVDVTAAQFLRTVESPTGPPPGSFLGGVSGLSSRERAYFTANLRPGTYTLVCFVPDHKDGKPHIAHGMFRDITVE